MLPVDLRADKMSGLRIVEVEFIMNKWLISLTDQQSYEERNLQHFWIG